VVRAIAILIAIVIDYRPRAVGVAALGGRDTGQCDVRIILRQVMQPRRAASGYRSSVRSIVIVQLRFRAASCFRPQLRLIAYVSFALLCRHAVFRLRSRRRRRSRERMEQLNVEFDRRGCGFEVFERC